MLLNLKNLCRQYQRGEQSFNAVDNVSLTMADNEFITVIGRSGSGKTTLLNMITGIVSPTSGSITFNGVETPSLDDRKMSGLRNQCMGYIPQGSSLLANLSVLDNIRLPFYLSETRRQGDDCPARELLARVGLSHLQNMFPATLSGGEARRVAIARALVNSPKLLIADEPTSDLDVETTHEVMQLLLELNRQGTALLLVTHDRETSAYSRNVIKMSNGRIV